MKHVIILPVKASLGDIERVQFLSKMSGQLYNACLGTMIGRVEQVRRDKRWQALRNEPASLIRSKAYNDLKNEYGLSEFDCIKVVQAHARDSGWIAEHIDGRMQTALGKEVWPHISLWLHGKGGTPRYIKSNERRVISGNDNRAGLRYQDGQIIHSTSKINQAKKNENPLGDKSLKTRVQWGEMPKARAAYYQDEINKGNIRKVSIVLNDDQTAIMAHIVMDCAPYRSKEKKIQAQAVKDNTVSFDLGPSSLAYVSPDQNKQGVIQPSAKLMKQVKHERGNRKRLQRKLQRSRLATNPDCYADDGQYIPGKKIANKSKAYQQTQAKIKQSHKRERKLINTWHGTAVDQVISLGLNIITEKDTIKDWQEKGYGKSVNLLAPATLKNRLMHESKVLGGAQVELNTYLTWLSQSCICGKRTKKELRERVHACQNKDCLLLDTPLHRDKFAALLGLWVRELGAVSRKNTQTKITTTVFNEKLGVKKLLNKNYHTNEHRTIAIALCAVGSLDHKPDNSLVSMAAISRGLEKIEVSKEAHENEFLSKPLRSPLGEILPKDNDRKGRVIIPNAAYIRPNNTDSG